MRNIRILCLIDIIFIAFPLVRRFCYLCFFSPASQNSEEINRFFTILFLVIVVSQNADLSQHRLIFFICWSFFIFNVKYDPTENSKEHNVEQIVTCNLSHRSIQVIDTSTDKVMNHLYHRYGIWGVLSALDPLNLFHNIAYRCRQRPNSNDPQKDHSTPIHIKILIPFKVAPDEPNTIKENSDQHKVNKCED